MNVVRRRDHFVGLSPVYESSTLSTAAVHGEPVRYCTVCTVYIVQYFKGKAQMQFIEQWLENI